MSREKRNPKFILGTIDDSFTCRKLFQEQGESRISQ